MTSNLLLAALTPNELRDWLLLGVMCVGWAASVSVVWTKLVSKVNGLGGRVQKTEKHCTETNSRMDHVEKDLAEYRRDARDALSKMGQVEKAMDALKDEVTNGNQAIGVQLHDIERLIHDKDLSTTNRLVRIETVQRIEQKVGPIPADA